MNSGLHTLNRKGLSDIVSAILFILIILIAVGLIWAFVRPLLVQSGDELSVSNCFSISLSKASCSYVDGSIYATVSFQRNAGEGNLSGLSFIFYNQDGTSLRVSDKQTFAPRPSPSLPRELESYRAVFNLSASPKKEVLIVPSVGNNKLCESAQQKVLCYPQELNNKCSDYNGDGSVNPDDLGEFITDYFAIPPNQAGCQDADPSTGCVDFDENGIVDLSDFEAFIRAYFNPRAQLNC